jgi:hypothetical protein
MTLRASMILAAVLSSMRWLVSAALLVAVDARADVSLPMAGAHGAGSGDCDAIFEEARRAAAAHDPRFALARLEHGRGSWDLTLQRPGGLYATVSVFPLPIDARQDWIDVGDNQPAYIRWIDHREGLVVISGLAPAVERPVRALFQAAADRCLARLAPQ